MRAVKFKSTSHNVAVPCKAKPMQTFLELGSPDTVVPCKSKPLPCPQVVPTEPLRHVVVSDEPQVDKLDTCTHVDYICSPRDYVGSPLKDACRWCLHGVQGSAEHWLIGDPLPAQDVNRLLGAGVIALRGVKAWSSSVCSFQVCLVNRRNGALNFPRSSRKDQESAFQCAFREWRKNISSPGTERHVSKRILIDADVGWHYFIVECDWSENAPEVVWAPECDILESNPVVQAQWIAVSRALEHPNFTSKRKAMLMHALDYSAEANQEELGRHNMHENSFYETFSQGVPLFFPQQMSAEEVLSKTHVTLS